MITCHLLSIWLILGPSINSLHNPVIIQSSNSEASLKNNQKDSTGHSSIASSPRSIIHSISSPQPIDQLDYSSKLNNVTLLSSLRGPASAFSPYRHQQHQYHFPQPLPQIPIYPINTNLITQSPKPTPIPTYANSNEQDQPEFPITHSNHRRRSLNSRDQPQWPGTDTVYATKTVFVSSPGPPTTVFVSNGQIVSPPSPTPYIINSSNGQNVWVSPSGNPNLVVATVTAYSSAKRFAWDGLRSNSFFKIFIFANLTHLCIIFGFGLVNNLGL